MASPNPIQNGEHDGTLQSLNELRRFAGPPRDFWPRYLACLGQLCAASRVVLLVRNAAGTEGWKKLVEWSAEGGAAKHGAVFASQLETVAERCAQDTHFVSPLATAAGRGNGAFILADKIRLLRAEEQCVAVCLLPEASEASARETLLRLNLAADTPSSYQENLAAQQAKADVEKLAGALDLMIQVNAEKKFVAAALAFCNGLATRFGCDRVSLGWLQRGYIRLRAISRTENFNRQMAAAQALETAMEEALDQDDEVVWPAPEEATVVARDHEAFAREQKVDYLCSLPLRVDDKVVAVLTCERQSAAFSAAELQQLRLCADTAARRLADLRHYDRWFGARWATTAREQLGKVVGPEHTWIKVLTLVIVALLAVLFFLRVPYRVEGNFVLRSDEVAYLTAPFDGYIDSVPVRPGMAVKAGDPLLRFKTSELELEESAALADWNRYQREAEKSRAANSLAEMRIAEAMANQAKARLDLTRYRINQAVIKSPFAGVIVEGDLRERLGSPVKQADVLFKVARVDTLYIEAEINERDIHEIIGKHTGEMAFVSQPQLKFPIRIVNIEQAAFPKNEKNVFQVRCAVEGGPQPWWRPGMSGLCKFNVEKRTLIWIVSHRTVDFLRMLFWW